MHPYLLLFVTVAAALVSVVASLTAARSYVLCSTLASTLADLRKRNESALLRVTELDDLCARTQLSVAKLRSRAGMNELREKESGDDPQLTGPEWKDKMRKQLKINIGVNRASK